MESIVKKTSGLRDKQKGHFSGHETFPLRQLWLPKAYRAAVSAGFESSVFSDDSAIAVFGVGKNMVSSIRHWALATEVLTETGGTLKAGYLGKFLIGDPLGIVGVDPWFENPSSVWLVHWALTARGCRSTTWKWLFSHVSDAVFDKERLLSQLQSWCVSRGWSANVNTLKRDLDTCIRGYLPRATATTPEEAAEPLLSELGLLKSDSGSGMRFNRGPKPSLNDYIFYYCVLDYWESKHRGEGRTPTTVPLMNLSLDFYGPGRVFKISEDEIEERLNRAELKTDGLLSFVDSANGRHLVINDRFLTSKTGPGLLDWETAKLSLAKRAYRG